MHEIHTPQSTQQRATVIIKKLYTFPGRERRKNVLEIFNKTEAVEINLSRCMFYLVNLMSEVIEQNMSIFTNKVTLKL